MQWPNCAEMAAIESKDDVRAEPFRSASAITDASVPPSGKWPYCSTSSAIRCHSSGRGASTSNALRLRKKVASSLGLIRDPIR